MNEIVLKLPSLTKLSRGWLLLSVPIGVVVGIIIKLHGLLFLLGMVGTGVVFLFVFGCFIGGVALVSEHYEDKEKS